jgi:hypothetical protein
VCNVLTPCEDYYLPDSVVELTASPGAGTRFTGWSGGACSGPVPTCTVTLDSDKEVKAEFVVLHTVTVTKSGSGSGTVTNTPAGIDCGATCTGTFDHGTPIILTATPAAGSAFAGWSGGGCSGTGPCEVADADASVTAVRRWIHTANANANDHADA